MGAFPWEEIEKTYGLRVEGCEPVRSAFRLTTDQGALFLKRSRLSPMELRFVTAALVHLDRRGFGQTPRVIATKAGEPYLETGPERFMLTEWRDGVECDFDNLDDTLATATLIAELHQASCGFSPPPGDLRLRYGAWPSLFRRRFGELDLFARIAARKGEPNEFDREFLERVNEQRSYGEAAYAWLMASRYPSLVFHARQQHLFCHHDLAHHNVIREPGGRCSLIDFDYALCDLRVHDLANLLRRILKRSGWESDRAWQVIAQYDRLARLSPVEIEMLAVLLWWPQEFWQIAFQYYYDRLPWPLERFVDAIRTKSARPPGQRVFVDELRSAAGHRRMWR